MEGAFRFLHGLGGGFGEMDGEVLEWLHICLNLALLGDSFYMWVLRKAKMVTMNSKFGDHPPKKKPENGF